VAAALIGVFTLSGASATGLIERRAATFFAGQERPDFLAAAGG